MKTLIIAIIMGVIAHAAAGALMESKTAKNLKNHNAQIELAVKGM
ncbi:MAG: hypothetical protein AB7U24_08710 [Sulfurimonadaceae bacterium]|jgi:hypothetical protein